MRRRPLRRPLPTASGELGTTSPSNDFATFLPLDRATERAWRVELYGSAATDGGTDVIAGLAVSDRGPVAASASRRLCRARRGLPAHRVIARRQMRRSPAQIPAPILPYRCRNRVETRASARARAQRRRKLRWIVQARAHPGSAMFTRSRMRRGPVAFARVGRGGAHFERRSRKVPAVLHHVRNAKIRLKMPRSGR